MEAVITSSSADLRIRDKIKAMEEKHQKEIVLLETKLLRYRAVWDASSQAAQDATAQGQKLASALGFRTVLEAQTFIDIADDRTPYRELTERIEELQRSLSRERNDNEGLRDEVKELRRQRDLGKENDHFERSMILSPSNSTSQSSKSAEVLQQQLSVLQRRFDDLSDVKRRAAERYKADFGRMKKIMANIREGDKKYKVDASGLSREEQKLKLMQLVSARQKSMREFELLLDRTGDGNDGDSIPVVGVPESDSEKENQETPVPQKRKRPPAGSPLFASGVPTLVASTVTSGTKPHSVVPLSAGKSRMSSSSGLMAIAHVPLQFKPVGNEKAQQNLSSPAPKAPWNPGQVLITNSSDTEEDLSQTQDPFTVFQVPSIPDPLRTAMEEDRKPPVLSASTDSKSNPRAAHHTLPPRPSFGRLDDQRSRSKMRHSDTGNSTSSACADDGERPHKLRRVSSPGPSARRTSTGDSGGSTATPLYVCGGDTPRRNEDCHRVKGKQGEQQVGAQPSTPLNAIAIPSSSKQLADYSSYKGRGRYANDGVNGNTTINSIFAIDPAKNGGKNFQYDEVVRGRDDRRHMEAGDCECCRDYYEAIGSMPNRLQPPLWRSPSSSPSEPKPCFRAGSAPKDTADITSHKQAISRHRHHWARASTPPGYWNIGFPSTQEAADINEKAKELHQQKKKNVQEEAERGGRYKKR
ncbi:DNA repair protein endonuclease SAE2/CtIP C-terminus-domain-containing protein [Mycena sp. CBHHK59/15]|nr:DNA repair protein endonuclease SAE2/CtIP C-terminus-domain-containing protein [Mycena sp. CBHHK59/15]